MAKNPFFAPSEYDARLRALRAQMEERGIDACLLTSPEAIYYLTGLDHAGYFAYHGLIVPARDQMRLLARAMEQVTMETFLVNTRFVGYADGADSPTLTAAQLRAVAPATGTIGVEKDSLFLPVRVWEAVNLALPRAAAVDVSDLVYAQRAVKSTAEVAYTRRAAAVADAMMEAAIATAAAGVNERDVAAAVYEAMVRHGGEPPGFSPFVRSTARLGQEHRTWEDQTLQPGDALFVELAGCVRRYHAAMGRLIYIGGAPAAAQDMARVCLEAFAEAATALQPGARARDVYRAWQDRVDAAGLPHYRRHHCGYMIGIGFPPSWVGGNKVVGLRHDSDLQLEAGMVFHLMSWLMGTGRGDYFVSDTARVTGDGCEVLTSVSQEMQVA